MVTDTQDLLVLPMRPDNSFVAFHSVARTTPHNAPPLLPFPLCMHAVCGFPVAVGCLLAILHCVPVRPHCHSMNDGFRMKVMVMISLSAFLDRALLIPSSVGKSHTLALHERRACPPPTEPGELALRASAPSVSFFVLTPQTPQGLALSTTPSLPCT